MSVLPSAAARGGPSIMGRHLFSSRGTASLPRIALTLTQPAHRAPSIKATSSALLPDIRSLHVTSTARKKQAGRSHGTGKEFSHTLQLPSTPFGIRANAAKRDHLFYDRTCGELYSWQKSRPDTTGEFVFHDGPPYANGNLHCGHALNKILKDITNRYQVLRGKNVHFMPGWDCHGLPIEAKALAKVSPEDRPKWSARDIRRRARQEAKKAIEIQKQEFRQFGIMADWSESATYRTLDPAYEARQLRVFGEMVRKGLIYRQYRPVYWSPSNQTALAESELEYREDHSSKAVYVAFDLLAGPSLLAKMGEQVKEAHQLKAIIWTTTPWSLPSNMAISVHPELHYSLVRRSGSDGPRYLVGTDRIEVLETLPVDCTGGQHEGKQELFGPLQEIVRLQGVDLADSTYRSPLCLPEAGARRFLMADYVTALSGTGLVHSAPAHGAEDYQVWKQHGGIEKDGIFSPINDEGRYSQDILQLDAPTGQVSSGDGSVGQRLIGKDVLGEGAHEVIRILKERGALICAHTLRHKYPYDWRSKQPVIVRATAQWFANLDRIKQQAVEALRDVTFVPANSRSRLEAFIKGRSEWCISRQRVWGVPIPVLYDAATDEPLMTVENIEHIASVLESKGTDHWWEADADEFVAPQYRDEKRTWRKGEDTVDVWFDSGTSWATLKDQLAIDLGRKDEAGQGSIADVYLEGSDQHRGWFQSSLITAVATTPEGQKPIAPYKTVVTHGYVLDNESRKMSKSLGNVISPLTIIQGGDGANQPAYGTDVLRLWVARSDYTTDPPIGDTIISKTAETLRKLRNTARFMLANVPAGSVVADLDASRMRLLDRFVMRELHSLEQACAAAYEAYDFAQVVRRLTEFANATLSNLYLDVGKDCLYLDAAGDPRRQTMVAVIDTILRTMTGIMAPITPFLCEEIFHFRNGAERDPTEGVKGAPSVFSGGWPSVDARWNDTTAAAHCQELLKLRDASLIMIEETRQHCGIKTSFEVEIDLLVTDDQSPISSILTAYESELTELFNVASVNVVHQNPTGDAEFSRALLSRTQDQAVTIQNARSNALRLIFRHLIIRGSLDHPKLPSLRRTSSGFESGLDLRAGWSSSDDLETMKAPKMKHSPSSSNGINDPDSPAMPSTSTHAAGAPYPSKLLACVACRNSKVKCISDRPEQCKRCLDHGLTCIRPEYQRLKKAKAKLARFQQQANLDVQPETKPAPDRSIDASEPLPPERPILPQESPTTLFSNASYGKSAQLLSNLHIVRLDVRDEWDPVAVGIMEVQTSQTLFNTFMVKLEALLSFFDPRIHTYDYIRSQSCLLFTTMCWLASTVSDFPSAPQIMHDLKNHIDNVLLPAIYCQNLRSVEIVQGFLMLAAYLRPAQNPSEDRSWTLLGHAIRVATDLDMHSRALSTSQQHQAPAQSAPAGFGGTPPDADASKQQETWHQRNRERAWMHIWLHEASSSQYTGRVSLLSKDPIVESSRGWHLHPEALHTDVVFVALIELRSQLSQNKELFRMLSTRAGAANNASPSSSGAGATSAPNESDSSWIRHYLDRCHRDLSTWEERWVVNPSRSASHPRPLRFELGSLYICYARMQLLSLPLQWPTLPSSMTTRIVSDLHSVSIRYLEDFLDRTSPQRLAHSYNSICVTATYAVVISLKLTKLAPTYTFINSPRIIRLVARVSEYLRKGGNWTLHQNGSSLSYARYIDRLLDMESSNAPQSGPAGSGAAPPTKRAGDALDDSGQESRADESLANEKHTNSSHSALRYRMPPGGPAMAPSESISRGTHAPSLQRAHSAISHPLSSPRTIYTATPGSDGGLFPRISASPHAQGAPPVVPGPTTPSSHFAIPPGMPTPLAAAGVVTTDAFQYGTAPGVEPGHPQWSFLANDPELFAWARSFLNDELDVTMPGATFH